MRVVVFGAGRVGSSLVKFLEEKRDLKIVVVDEDKRVCDVLASESNANVICGDATDPKLLDELNLKGADFVFAVTGNEEVNFLTSVYAKQANCKSVISRSSEPKYSKLMERLDIQPLISEATLARELANMAVSPVISKMLDPTYSHIELLEKEVSNDLNNVTVADATKKKGFMIVSIYDNEKFMEPSPKVVLKKGMKIITIKYNL